MLSPETDICPSWISRRERMTVENISWSISAKECCRPRRGLNPWPPGLQSDLHPTKPPRPVDLKVNVGHCDLYFMVQWFCLISWMLFDVWTSFYYYELVWSDSWPKSKCLEDNLMFDYYSLGLCDLYFIALWFCLISPTVWCLSVIFTYNIMTQCDPNFDLKVNINNINQYDLYSWLVILLNIF